MAITEKAATERGLVLGQQITTTFLQGGTTQLTLEAIYDTRFPIRGPGWLVTQERFDAGVPPAQQTDSAVYIQLVDDSDAGVAAARPALQQIADAVPGAELQDVDEYQRSQTAQVDQFLLVVYVLLALALVIATVGVVNTLLLSVTERTRELGLLRAVGMTRRQLRSGIRWESLIIAFVGTITGLVLGLILGGALVRALRDDGITIFEIPWRPLLVILEITDPGRHRRRDLPGLAGLAPRRPRGHRHGVSRQSRPYPPRPPAPTTSGAPAPWPTIPPP